MFFEILKKKWNAVNFAVDTSHIANSSVEVDSEIFENALKALFEIRYDSNSYILEMAMQSSWVLFFII